MIKRKLIFIICIILGMSFIISCKSQNKPIEIDIDESTKQEEIEIQSPIIKVSDGLEMRDAKLWIKQEDTNKLELDGEPFIIPSNIIEAFEFSHLNINYPLMIFNTNSVYDMENDEILFTMDDLAPALESQWKSLLKGITPLKGGEKMQPEWFDYIGMVEYSPSQKRVFFDLTHYSTAVTDSVMGLIDMESKEVNFTNGPITGEVIKASWSHDEEYIAYIHEKHFSWSLYIDETINFKNKFALDHKELLSEEVKIRDMDVDADISEPYYEIIDMSIEWKVNKAGVLCFKGEYIYPSPDKEIRFTRVIDLGIGSN